MVEKMETCINDYVGDKSMSITDEQVRKALKQIPHDYPTTLQPYVVKQMVEAAIQAAWVSVDDRLPDAVYVDGIESYKEYLVYETMNKKVSHDYFHSSHGWNHYCGYVTCWMPLPMYGEIAERTSPANTHISIDTHKALISKLASETYTVIGALYASNGDLPDRTYETILDKLMNIINNPDILQSSEGLLVPF
jgi:hypothetical protein